MLLEGGVARRVEFFFQAAVRRAAPSHSDVVRRRARAHAHLDARPRPIARGVDDDEERVDPRKTNCARIPKYQYALVPDE